MASEPLGGSDKTDCWAHPTVPETVGLGRGLRIWILTRRCRFWAEARTLRTTGLVSSYPWKGSSMRTLGVALRKFNHNQIDHSETENGVKHHWVTSECPRSEGDNIWFVKSQMHPLPFLRAKHWTAAVTAVTELTDLKVEKRQMCVQCEMTTFHFISQYRRSLLIIFFLFKQKCN